MQTAVKEPSRQHGKEARFNASDKAGMRDICHETNHDEQAACRTGGRQQIITHIKKAGLAVARRQEALWTDWMRPAKWSGARQRAGPPREPLPLAALAACPQSAL